MATAYDYPALVAESVYAFADLIESLDEGQLDTLSLCEGWRVRDVAGHICTGVTMTIPAVLRDTAKAGFSVPKASGKGAVEYANTHSAKDMAATIRGGADVYAKHLPKKGMLRVLKPTDLVLDNLVHTLDIRRPLGLPSDVPPHRMLAALAVAPTTKGFVKAHKRSGGLRFVATDIEWSWGSGPEVRGPAEAILLALTGRPVALAELEGDGVELLRARL